MNNFILEGHSLLNQYITMWRIKMLELFMYFKQNSHKYSFGSLQNTTSYYSNFTPMGLICLKQRCVKHVTEKNRMKLGAKCLSYNSNTVRIPFLFSGYRTRKVKKSLFLTSVKKMGKINASLPGSSFWVITQRFSPLYEGRVYDLCTAAPSLQ